MAKTRSITVSPIYSGDHPSAVNRSAAGILSRKNKIKPRTKSEREEIARRLAKKSARVRRSVAKQRRIALEYFRDKARERSEE